MKGNYKNHIKMNSQCENSFSQNDKLKKTYEDAYQEEIL